MSRMTDIVDSWLDDIYPQQGLIIGFGHKAQRGKDTAADYLVKEHGFTKLSFAGHLKEVVKTAFLLTDDEVYGTEKLEVHPFLTKVFGKPTTPVDVLQFFGTEVFRELVHKDFWILVVQQKIALLPEGTNVVLADTRFPDEGDAILEMGGKVYKVDGPQRRDTGRDPNHPSETAMDDYDRWTGIILNHGTLRDLYDKVEAVLTGYAE